MPASEIESLPAFKRLYLDTTVLHGSHWPTVSGRLASLVEIARNFNVRVFVPQPVEDEREAQWVRDVTKAFAVVKKSRKELSTQLSAVGAGLPNMDGPDVPDLRDRYRKASAASRERLGVELSAMTGRAASALFPQAIAHEAPFQETGDRVTGFQDAVIFFSIIDDTLASGETICAFYSEDGGFSKNTGLAAVEGVTFQHVKTFDAVWNIFADEIVPALSAWWIADREAAKSAVETAKAVIEDFLAKDVQLDALGLIVKEVRVAKIVYIREVDTPLPPFPNHPGPYQRAPDSVIKITITLAG